eukprot:TRINITY_DN1201_c0_g1_i12.p1 TRINITY_DN1201_c0_g1~~TRINITY_DN1201_c0_g1_i12.p1  ORF type:complete len:168 (-),score=26.71 TRINITY_DN1201_c0_g1_i12:122-625(-)
MKLVSLVRSRKEDEALASSDIVHHAQIILKSFKERALLGKQPVSPYFVKSKSLIETKISEIGQKFRVTSFPAFLKIFLTSEQPSSEEVGDGYEEFKERCGLIQRYLSKYHQVTTRFMEKQIHVNREIIGGNCGYYLITEQPTAQTVLSFPLYIQFIWDLTSANDSYT